MIDGRPLSLLAMAGMVLSGWCTEEEGEAIWSMLQDRKPTEMTVAATLVTLRQLRAIVRAMPFQPPSI